MRVTTRIAILLAALLLPALAGLGQNTHDSDPDIPVLKRRPPAGDTQQTNPPADTTESQPAQPPDTTGGQSEQQTVPASPQPLPAEASAAAAVHDSHVEAAEGSQPTSATTRRITLTKSGGVLRITMDDPDQDGAEIASHLREVAAQYARGEFTGRERADSSIALLQQLRRKITYTAHAIDGGAELIISSEDPKAVDAIHRFLQAQMRDQ